MLFSSDAKFIVVHTAQSR